MGSIVDTVTDAVGLGSRNKAIDASTAEAARNRNWQTEMWERQYGPINDLMMDYMSKVLGGESVPETPFQQQYRTSIRQEIDSGIRPGEQAARDALMDKVRANPQGMSNQAYSKSLKDLVYQGSKARGEAYRKGESEVKMLPYSMGMSFLNRTPYKPDSANYMPNYTSSFDPQAASLMGGGLSELISQGSRAWNALTGSGGADFSSITGSPDYANFADIGYTDENFGLT